MTRLRYIDLAKGLGILCITFLHYENGVLLGTINTFIGSFMISIFYVVAGMVMAMKESEMSVRELAHRRLRSIGRPYLYWSLIILTFDCILWACGYYNTYFIARETYKTIVLRGIGTLWFLPALFFGEIGWYWLRRQKKVWWIIALIGIIAYQFLYGSCFTSRTSDMWKIIAAPFYTINHAFGAIIYVAAGYLIHKCLWRSMLKQWQEVLIGFILCCAGYYTASYLDLLIGQTIANMTWQFFAPILGPIGFILIFRSVQNYRCLNYFDYWGRNSLSLMVTHYSIVQVLLTIIVVDVLDRPFIGWITILAFIISLPIQHFITYLLNHYAPQLIQNRKW